jgi:hypothetical protein
VHPTEKKKSSFEKKKKKKKKKKKRLKSYSMRRLPKLSQSTKSEQSSELLNRRQPEFVNGQPCNSKTRQAKFIFHKININT